VLPPGSSFVPFLADDLLAALELGLAESGLASDLLTEFADCNADVKIVAPRLQQLLIGGRVAVVIAPFNVALIEKVATHFQSRTRPLVALTLGEDPLFESARNPYVFVNSHQLWRAAWMCGYLGVKRFGPRAAMLLALHEGGYGLAFAFQLGLEAAGGELLQTHVTHRSSRTEDPSEPIAATVAASPDFVWAAYSGTEAISFLTAYDSSGCRGRIPLLGLSPLVEPHVREAAGAAALGAYIVTPGPRSTDDHPLTVGLARALGHPPHPYAMLAYESARLLAAAVASSKGDAAGLAAALREAEFVGPRGVTRFDTGTERQTPFCVRVIQATGATVEQVESLPIIDEQCAVARTNLVKQGWVNPYLCA
jgi:ABC-type branched-subunit amino acid transport system substrate-binding protein